MDKYAEEHETFIDSLKGCEYDLITNMLEAGATWEKAVKTLKETKEKLGEPILIEFEQRGRQYIRYEWPEEIQEPTEEIESV